MASMGNNMVLNRLFTKNILHDIIHEEHSKLYSSIIGKYIPEFKSKTNRELFEDIYDYMSTDYRNEYFYQNTILNKILLGCHSPRTTAAITQLPVDKSIIDFILINGKATVYEIKTDLDNFERLESQLNDYYKAFNCVYVVTNEENFEKLSLILKDTNVGIRVIMKNKKDTISKKICKAAVIDNSKLSHESIFKVLRKQEYEKILINTFGELPETFPVFQYRECLERFSRIPIVEAHNKMVAELKKRNNVNIEKFSKIPYELKSLVYFYNPNDDDYQKINRFLNKKMGEN